VFSRRGQAQSNVSLRDLKEHEAMIATNLPVMLQDGFPPDHVASGHHRYLHSRGSTSCQLLSYERNLLGHPRHDRTVANKSDSKARDLGLQRYDGQSKRERG
jgi:hypothetical protein